jgi:thioredoxin 2
VVRSLPHGQPGSGAAGDGVRPGKLKLVKVNADEAPETSRRFEVQAIPTLVLMHHGKVVDKQIGAAPAHALRSWLTEHLPKAEVEPTQENDQSTGDDRP